MDKRSVVVILDKNITKIREILKDETNNKIIDTNVDNIIIPKITKFSKTHNKTQTKKKEKDFFTNYILKNNKISLTTKNHGSNEMKKNP